MNKFAVIDVGSNSVRLMLVANGKVLYKTIQTTRLGEGLSVAPLLKTSAIERSAQAVKTFYDCARKEGAEQVLAFATAAVRTAKNGAEFIKRVKELCGLSVEIISGEEEAELGILGALGYQDGGILDIGGASTELIFRTSGKITYKKSVNVGVVRLKERCGNDPKLYYLTAEESVREFGKVENGHTVYAIGGTATTLGAVALGLINYDGSKVSGTVLSLDQVKALSARLQSLSVEEIAKIPCVPLLRADVLTGGVIWLESIMERLNISKIVVSDSDNLEGYAKKQGLLE